MLGITAKVTASLVMTLSSIRSFHQVTKSSAGSEAFRINVSHLFFPSILMPHFSAAHSLGVCSPVRMEYWTSGP